MNPKQTGYTNRGYGQRPDERDAYGDFDATELYCNRCRQAVPVRKRLLLVLPEGDKFEYLCAYCSTSVGTKTERDTRPKSLII